MKKSVDFSVHPMGIRPATEQKTGVNLKKIGIILIALFGLLAAGLALFILTFDVNRFKPLLIKEIETATGHEVKIDGLSLVWKNGIAVQMRGLALTTPESAREPFLTLTSANAVLEFMPLLNRQIQVASIILEEPFVRFLRDSSGEWRFSKRRTDPATGSAAVPPDPDISRPSGGAPGAAFFSFLIQTLKAEDGRILYRDESSKPPVEIDLDNIDLRVRDVSLQRPMSFEVRAALWNSKQNIEISGKAGLAGAGGTPYLENTRLQADLSSVNIEELAKAFSAVSSFGISEQIQGRLTVDLDSLKTSQRGIEDLSARMQMRQGRVALSGIAVPADGISFDARALMDRLEIENLSMTLGSGQITARSTVNAWLAEPRLQFGTVARGIRLRELLPPTDSRQPHLTGTLSFEFQGNAWSPPGVQLLSTLQGEGKLDWAEAALANMNLLSEAFRKLSILPGLTETLMSRLPPEYKEKFEAQDTRFEPVHLPFAMKGGILSFDRLQLASDTFVLEGQGQVAFQGWIHAAAALRIDAPLSAAIIRSVNELQYLSDPGGRLEIPLTVQGSGADVRVLPNLQYIASRLAVAKTQEVLGRWLGTDKPKTPPAGTGQTQPQLEPDQASSQTSKGEPVQEILNLLFREPKSSSGGSGGTQ